MRPAENIKRLITNARIRINPEVKRAAFKELVNELEKSSNIIRPVVTKPNIGRIIKQSLTMKLAAAVVIITTLYFIIFYASTNEQSGNIVREVQLKSPAEMMSVLTINTIYRQQGFDAVQRHLEKINEMKGASQRDTITLCDILAELNGNGHDRRQL